MAACSYDQIRPDLKYVADRFKAEGIEYSAYNGGVQYNAKDLNGTIHSFYPTTGTVILHASNDRNDHRIKTFREQNLESFIKGMKCRHLNRIYFKEDK